MIEADLVQTQATDQLAWRMDLFDAASRSAGGSKLVSDDLTWDFTWAADHRKCYCQDVHEGACRHRVLKRKASAINAGAETTDEDSKRRKLPKIFHRPGDDPTRYPCHEQQYRMQDAMDRCRDSLAKWKGWQVPPYQPRAGVPSQRVRNYSAMWLAEASRTVARLERTPPQQWQTLRPGNVPMQSGFTPQRPPTGVDAQRRPLGPCASSQLRQGGVVGQIQPAAAPEGQQQTVSGGLRVAQGAGDPDDNAPGEDERINDIPRQPGKAAPKSHRASGRSKSGSGSLRGKDVAKERQRQTSRQAVTGNAGGNKRPDAGPHLHWIERAFCLKEPAPKGPRYIERSYLWLRRHPRYTALIILGFAELSNLPIPFIRRWVPRWCISRLLRMVWSQRAAICVFAQG
jgi:hypothetical protein